MLTVFLELSVKIRGSYMAWQSQPEAEMLT